MAGRYTLTTKRIAVLGATGSVGASCLDLVRRNKQSFEVSLLTAHSSVPELAALALEFRPDLTVIADGEHLAALKSALAPHGLRCEGGQSALVAAAAEPADLLVAGIVGAAGLAPTLAAVEQGHAIALANKECLISAGALFMRTAKRSGSTILPLDSEHNAIFQVLDPAHRQDVARVILTASGGPFRSRPLDSLDRVTPSEAVDHPNWSMGPKISVDSATMMNKGLEVIEARYLFDLQPSEIEVVIHPQSIIHSMVAYRDGSILAQLGPADMRVPMAHCLAWPHRMRTPCEQLDFAAIARLDFAEPDLARFPCLGLALAALRRGGAAPLVLNAANEVAVAAFLAGRLRFTEIASAVGRALDRFDMKEPHSLATVTEIDREIREYTKGFVAAFGANC